MGCCTKDELEQPSFETSQIKKRRTTRNATAMRKMTMGTTATQSERTLAVAKSVHPPAPWDIRFYWQAVEQVL